jgi:hypothetical protein
MLPNSYHMLSRSPCDAVARQLRHNMNIQSTRTFKGSKRSNVQHMPLQQDSLHNEAEKMPRRQIASSSAQPDVFQRLQLKLVH